MIEEMGDTLKFILVNIAVLILAIALTVGLFTLIDQPVCNMQTENIGMPHYWSIWTGCMVQPKEGQWIPLNNWRFVEQ